MIKSVVESKDGNTYPCIMIMKNGITVLFEKESCGTVINASNSVYNIGDYVDKFDMDEFNPFYGSVTLTQD